MQTELNPLPSSLFHLNTLSRRFNSSRRNMWGNCWCGNVLRLQHAVGIQSEGTVAHSVSSSSLANCFTETLRGFKTVMGLVGFGWTLLPLFRGFPPTVALFSCQQIRSKVPLYNSHFKCACVSLCHRCALLCVCAVFMWKHCGTQGEDQQLFTSWKALVICWHRTPQCFRTSLTGHNPEVWPAQTIKGMPTVILALFFHYGSAAAGVLISDVGLLRKWMGTDSAETGAPGVPMSWLLRASIGREIALIFRLLIGISLHLFAQFACQNSPPDWLSLLLRGILSCFVNYSLFPAL